MSMFGHISRLNNKISYFPLKNKKSFELSKKDYIFKNFNSNLNELIVVAKDGLNTELNIFVNSIIQEFSKIQKDYKFQKEELKLHLKQFKFNIKDTKLISFGLKKESFHSLGCNPMCFEKIKVTLLGITIFENEENNTISLKLVPNEIYYHSVNNIERQYYVTPEEFDIKKFDYDYDKKCFTYLDFEKHYSPSFLINCKLLTMYPLGNTNIFKLDCDSSFYKIIDNIKTKFKLENYQTKYVNAKIFIKDASHSSKFKCYINGKKEVIDINLLNKYKSLCDICHFSALIKPIIFVKDDKNLQTFNLQRLFIDIDVKDKFIIPLNTNYFYMSHEYPIFTKHMLHNETLKSYGFPEWDKYYYQKVKQFHRLFTLFPYYKQNSIVKTLENLKGQYKNVDDDKVIVNIGEQKVIKIFINDVYNLMENHMFFNFKTFKTEEDAIKMLIKYFSKNSKFNIYYMFYIKKIYNPTTKKTRKAFFVVANFNKITDETNINETPPKIEEKFKNIALEI